MVLDCGISRREGYTHVLWISASAEAIIGSHAYERLVQVMCSIPAVESCTWEGLDRLHLRAPGVDWDGLLAQARDAVSTVLPQGR